MTKATTSGNNHPRDRRDVLNRLRPRSGAGLLSAAALGLLGVSVPALGNQPGRPVASAGDSIVREGTGERRAKLDEMERSPFPREAWGMLSGWTGQAGDLPEGTALNALNTAGKVVVFYTWASYYPTSMSPLYQVGRLQKQYGDQGLIIVGVHAPEEYENAPARLAQRRADIVSAHDAEGRFREAIGSDQDPDFYLIDRAGQLRFADIATQSVEEAVTLLLSEEATDAATLNERLAAERERREREFRRLQGIRQQIEVSNLPRVPFSEPDSEAYGAVEWPEVRTDGRRNSRNVFSPSEASLPDEGWTPRKPDPHGQGMIFWFWDPLDRSTFDDEMQRFEELQLAHQRDLIVVGVALSTDEEERRRRNDDDDEDANARQQRRVEVYESMKTGRTLKQYWLADWESPFVEDAISGAEIDGARRGVRQIMPFVVSVASSDGVVRWVGAKADQRFERVVETLLREDPGVVSRRFAEAEFIRHRQPDAPLETGMSDEAGSEDDGN